MKRKAKAHRARWRRRLSLSVPTLLVASLMQGVAFPAAAKGHALPGAPAPGKPVIGKSATVKPRKTDPAPKMPQSKPKAAWPKGGKSTVDLSKVHGGAGRAVKANGLPVSLLPVARGRGTKGVTAAAPSGKAEVSVAERKVSKRAGVDGPLIVIKAEAPKAGMTAQTVAPTGVRLDYSGFAQAYGGGYASRLRLMELPEW
ncbi:hypothetical protein [Streptomyces sp. NPDC053048]|uniref:hypothetical protein n=1 Tax=Streptomyces sp. NPDC053048 TaxID=3365694 RepID=UPI0037D613D6